MSDADRVRNGEPVGAWGPNAGQHALGAGQPTNGNGNRKRRSKNNGLTGLPSQPQDHLQDSNTGSSGDQARDLEKIVNGNGGPRTGSSRVKGSGVSWGPNAGGVGSGPGPGNGGRQKKRRQRGGPRWSPGDDPNGGNGNGGPSGGPTPGSGTGYSGPSGGPSGGPGPGSGPSGNGNGNGGNGGSGSRQKTSRKGVKFGVPFVGGYLRGKREERETEERLARPRAEAIAKQQFGVGGIYEDTSQVTHYQVLGVSNTATPNEIEQAYRNKEADLRPDINPSQEAADALKLVQEAYAVLRDPGRRAAYDKSLQEYLGRMTKGMQKKAMGEARTGMKYEQDVRNEASSLGIPLTESGSRGVRRVKDLSVEERRQWARSQGIDDEVEDEALKQRPWGSIELTPTKGQTRNKPVYQLAREIAAIKGEKVSQATYLAEQQDEYKQIRPSKTTKVSRGVGKALAGGVKLAGKATSGSGRTGIGRVVQGQGRSGGADFGSIRDIQSPALGKIRAAGAGGIKRPKGMPQQSTPLGQLPITGKPIGRKPRKGF